MNETISDLIRISAMVLFVFLFSCGDNSRKVNGRKFAPPVEISYQQAIKEWKSNFGIGPVTKINLRNLDEILAKKGMDVYQEKCTACHAPDKDKLGPAPEGIMSRRTPEWIMNMILNPVEMATNDPIAKGLLKKYSTIMTNQKLTEEEAKAVLEYFRTL
jgi:mono/diheme cytochrome c family protein